MTFLRLNAIAQSAILFIAVSIAWSVEVPQGFESTEKKIEEALATNPDAKSLTGLLKVFSEDAPTLEQTNALTVQQLHELADKGRFHGVIMLAFAQKQQRSELSPEDAIKISLETMMNMPDKALLFGEGNPFLFYWQFFDQWSVFIANIPDLKNLLDRPAVIKFVFDTIPKEALGELISAPTFDSLPDTVRANLLQKAHEEKLIDLFDQRWQPIVADMYNDPSGDGGYFYFVFAVDRGDAFLDRLKNYIIKFEDDPKHLAMVRLAAGQDLKRLDILSLPLKDKTKQALVKTANAGNSPQKKSP